MLMSRQLAAVVLAGGASSRMGRDKALLLLPDGRSALERVLDVARRVADPVLLAVDTEAHAEHVRCHAGIDGTAVIVDLLPGAGPLATLAGALRAVPPPALLALAVDTPLVEARVLRLLHDAFLEGEADVALPLVGGIAQPMPAVYATALAPTAARLIAEGRRSLRALLDAPTVRVRPIGEDVLRAVDPQLRSFAGANTPEEWQRVLHVANAPAAPHRDAPRDRERR
jgi:molybdopterin-guanine dinucleotide biosynthesis protein A